MNQPTLFDNQLSRALDPWTSRKSASEDKQKRAAMAGHILAAFRVRPMTANEAAIYCVEQLGGDKESYRKRYDGLKKACLIRECGTRKCSWSGKTATIYTVNQ